jgi:1,4-alpha-glucan branching enzyme
MALDKYYGNRNAFKSLVNACHEQGIAVIMDVVFNHAFSTASICQLYWDDAASAPTANSPYANVVAKHPFNVGYDLNHESSATKYYTKRILKYLLEEYKVDGFRFDLSKGFTQKNSGNDAAAMSAYDASRIAIWTDYYNAVQSYSPGAYHILEHFADNSEEVELSKKGMMLWGNAVYNMTEAAMGFSANSDFGWGIDYSKRGFEPNGLVGYASSHDEERMAYQLLNYGNSGSGYSTRSNPIFLERMAMLYSYLWLTPGPKMVWQFDELGYDYSINYCVNGTINNACRLDNKPVRWDYWTGNANRKKLYYSNAMLLHLKNTYTDVNKPNNYSLSTNIKYKRLQLNGSSFTTLVYGSTDVSAQTVNPGFPFVGTWYDYLRGDSLVVSDINMSLSYKPGEFHVWTSKRIVNPFLSNLQSGVAKINQVEVEVFPNPTEGKVTVKWNSNISTGRFELYDLSGKRIQSGEVNNGSFIDFEGQKPGMYLYKIWLGDYAILRKLILN